MRNILRIFGRSPFIPLQIHMEKVGNCVDRIPDILTAYRGGDERAVRELSDSISKLEHEADLIKHDIRDNLPRSFFLPVARNDLLRILDIQDSIANRAENVGVILTFKQLRSFDELDEAFDIFVGKCLETFSLVRQVTDAFDELLEAGFGGHEANAARQLADKVARCEYESDVAQRALARVMFAGEEKISYADFFLWYRLVRQISRIADRSNNLATTIRSTLEG